MVRRALCCLAAIANVVAFTPSSAPHMMCRSSTVVLRSSETSTTTAPATTEGEVDDYDVTCYITNDEEVVTEGEKPHVVCTSEPDDVRYKIYMFYVCSTADARLFMNDIVLIHTISHHASCQYTKHVTSNSVRMV